jgi:hypothetical protein
MKRRRKTDDIDMDLDFDHDSERRYIQIHEVMDLLRSIDRHRQALQSILATLHNWLNGSDEFAAVWRKFTAAGGLDAEDFSWFIDGKFRSRRVRKIRHLRLVTSRKPPML